IQFCRSVTSSRRKLQLDPCACRSCCWFMSATMTVAPSRSSRRAVALPIPELPPVTSATWFAKRPIHAFLPGAKMNSDDRGRRVCHQYFIMWLDQLLVILPSSVLYQLEQSAAHTVCRISD